MNTKPWYLSVTIISSLVAGLAQVANLFHINITDLTPAITDAIGQQINATIAIAGAVGAIYGRIRATKQVTLGSTSPSVKLLPFALALGLGGACCSLVGCGTVPLPATNPTGATSSGTATTSTTSSAIEAALPLVRIGSAVATGAALDFAVKQTSTRTKLANEMYASANAIYTMTGTGNFPTVSQFQANILAYGGTQADANYAQYSSAIAALYASYYPKLVANPNVKTATDLLNAIAGGIEDATQSYVATPAPAVTASN